MLTLDGSMGEGGGQVLRTSLALSLVTGRPFRLERVRAGRERPGLMRQHLTAVRAAAAVGGALVTGDALGSRELTFEPSRVSPGAHSFTVGTAGSATLVLQTVLPALLRGEAPSTLALEGGTHNPWAPPWDFLERAFAPMVARLGPRLSLKLERPGFYPAGGGRGELTVTPVSALSGFEVLHRGEVISRRARVLTAGLPSHVAERELATLKESLGWDPESCSLEVLRPAWGPGNIVVLEVACEHVTEVFTSVGEKGVRAEDVALSAVREAEAWLASGVPVGQHLADQLLLLLALAGEGAFRTVEPTLHTLTQCEVIARFLPIKASCVRESELAWRVDVRRA